MEIWPWLAVASLLVPAPAIAQQPPPAAPAPPPLRCTGPEYREFDYMVGDWRVVHTATGQLMGQNRVEWVNLGCAIRENLVFPGRGEGSSFNFYSPIDQKWHGNYHDSSGLFAVFVGSIVDGRHIITSTIRFPNEPQREWRVRQITSRSDNGRPRQIGERWREDKKEWEQFYDVSFCPLTPQANEAAPCR